MQPVAYPELTVEKMIELRDIMQKSVSELEESLENGTCPDDDGAFYTDTYYGCLEPGAYTLLRDKYNELVSENTRLLSSRRGSTQREIAYDRLSRLQRELNLVDQITVEYYTNETLRKGRRISFGPFLIGHSGTFSK